MLEEVKRLKDGDLSAFTKFYEETKHKVFYNIYAILKDEGLSEDALQETYIRFLEKVSTLDEGKNALGFLFVISRNIALDFLRKRKKEVSLDSVSNIQKYSVHSFIEDDEVFNKMKKLLNKREFEIVVLRVIDEMSYKEISKLKHWPLGTITWIYQNAMKKLRKGWN